jgi:hypothetical protein
MQADWASLKSVLVNRGLSAQCVIVGSNYWVKAVDGVFALECILPVDTTGNADALDFVTNFLPTANQRTASNISGVVTTQYELNDKDLKLARVKVDIVDNTGTLAIKVPGTFGDGGGRYVGGGEAIIDTYDPDDFAMIYIEDKDRVICAALGLATDGSADATIQGMGVLPGPLAEFGALPNYPVVRSYTDDELDAANQGWYFYAEAKGSTLEPYGIMDIEPIGGYGFLPSGLYMKIVVNRPNVPTGTTRINIFWGKKE